MAMRLFSIKDFHAELTKHGLVLLPDKTNEHTFWRHEKTDEVFSIPNNDGIPDYFLDIILQKVGGLYVVAGCDSKKKYTVEEQAAAEEAASNS